MSAADVDYRSRGNRAEGVRPAAYAGGDIELLSARVDYAEPAIALPSSLKIRFYLPAALPVFITVREIEYRKYYWLDTVRPSQPWQAGFGNAFAWPTAEVVQPLGLTMYDLGVVARLGRPTPDLIERVAPVIYFHTRPPPTVPGYLFTFKTTDDARLRATISRDADGAAVHTQHLRSSAGTPVTVRWGAVGAPAGAYTLVVAAHLAHGNNETLQQTVHFAHQPSVPPGDASTPR